MRQTKSGITIIETMIALFILALMGGAIISLTLQILAANNSAKLKNQKVALVQQLLEQVRGFYQSNSWLVLSQAGNTSGRCYSDGTYSGNTLSTPLASCGLVCPTVGQEVKIVTNSPQVAVTATVTWSDRGNCLQTSETTYYYNY